VLLCRPLKTRRKKGDLDMKISNLRTAAPINSESSKTTKCGASSLVRGALYLLLLSAVIPSLAECQARAVLKPLLKKALTDVAIQVGTDGVISTGVDSYVNGEFTPSISEPAFEFIPKPLEFVPVVGDVIDVASTAVNGAEVIQAYYDLHITLERIHQQEAAIRRMLEERKRNAASRSAREAAARAEWLHSHYVNITDARAMHELAKNEQERVAAKQRMAEILRFARAQVLREGRNHFDISMLPPEERAFIERNFFTN